MNTLPIRKRTTPFSMLDGYKLFHHRAYSAEVTWVYSNFTPRNTRREDNDKFVVFGLQSALLKINEKFQLDFFNIPLTDALNDFNEFYKRYLETEDELLYARIAYLHGLGHLPLEIYAIAEGTPIPYGIPFVTINNTDPNCFWLTNLIETWLSTELWKAGTSATTAWQYRKMFDKYAKLTSDIEFLVPYQGHDFSMRGDSGVQDAMVVGAAHALSFIGSDTCPVFEFVDTFYPGSPSTEPIIRSVKATEHSTASSSILMELLGESEVINGIELTPMEVAEYKFIKRLLKENPTGILSYVTDTFDFWAVVTKVLRALMPEIMAREGTFVIRPDSSPKTPVEIICGDSEMPLGTPERRGLVGCLFDIFGGTINSKGFVQLDSHVGAIYGDSITLNYQNRILQGLFNLGFASTNIVLGIGSFTYAYVTRDTDGLAMKATAVGTGWVDGDPRVVIPAYKDPKTDTSGKKSARGLLAVVPDSEKGFVLREHDNIPDWINESKCQLECVFMNGTMELEPFSAIRARLRNYSQ